MDKPQSVLSGTTVPVYAVCDPMPVAATGLCLKSVTNVIPQNPRSKPIYPAGTSRHSHMQVSESAPEYSVDRLVTEIVHELKQPLTAISLLAESAKRRVAAGKDRTQDIEHSLKNIEMQAKRISKMIRGLRRFSSDNTLEKETVSIAGMIREVIELIEVEAKWNNVRLVADLEEGVELDIDKVLVEQVVINIIRNAIEAMKDVSAESRKLFIYAGQINNGVIISVKDNGPGMTREQAKHAFDTFFTSKPEGAGMGLVISRNIVKAHGGDISFCSSPGEGCTFYLTLEANNKGY